MKIKASGYLCGSSFIAYQERLRVMALRRLDNLSRRKRGKVPIPSANGGQISQTLLSNTHHIVSSSDPGRAFLFSGSDV